MRSNHLRRLKISEFRECRSITMCHYNESFTNDYFWVGQKRTGEWTIPSHGDVMTWASCQIRKSVGCACAENAENVFPATDFKGNHKLAIPTCITARASRTCRDACRDRQPAMAGENVPGIPGTCATRSFTYLARGPWKRHRWFPSTLVQ